jgi:STE24 endopeptidase
VNEDKASRYHRLKRRTSILSLAWGVVLLVGLLVSGLSIDLRNIADSWVRPLSLWSSAVPVAALSAYLVLIGALNEAASLPLAFYSGYIVEHRYELSTQTIGHWVLERGKGLAIAALFGLVGVNLLYGAIRRWPHDWWLAAGAGFSAITVLLANIAPVLLLPIFYHITPLTRGALRARLVALAGRAGVRVVDAYEWRISDRTKKANAALTGLGRTRRILVSDTLLGEYSDDEIEMVLAHELGHHVHRDIWKGIAFETTLAFAGFYLASRLLVALAPAAGLRGPADIAGLPLLLLAAGAVSLVLVPLANALSRTFERAADQYALDLGANAAAFISAMRRLGSQNLAEEHPSRLVRILFYSHPPIAERIDVARKRVA